MQQLPLNFLDQTQQFESEDFIVSAANIHAYQHVKLWPNWGEKRFDRILILYGKPACGKTHLAHIWQEDSKALILRREEINQPDFADLITNTQCYIIDSVTDLLEENFFHLLNLLMERQKFLLILSECPPQQLDIKLPDLRSRLNAVPVVEILPPDLELLHIILAKNFSDRQLQVKPEVITYLLKHSERSFKAINHLVTIIDQYSLQNKRNITIPLVKTILAACIN
ncbi:MAG: hypothetical protein RIT35_1293 [Pseudomonadota bacterium]|jgi:DnaA regulatory inactivator Hda